MSERAGRNDDVMVRLETSTNLARVLGKWPIEGSKKSMYLIGILPELTNVFEVGADAITEVVRGPVPLATPLGSITWAVGQTVPWLGSRVWIYRPHPLLQETWLYQGGWSIKSKPDPLGRTITLVRWDKLDLLVDGQHLPAAASYTLAMDLPPCISKGPSDYIWHLLVQGIEPPCRAGLEVSYGEAHRLNEAMRPAIQAAAARAGLAVPTPLPSASSQAQVSLPKDHHARRARPPSPIAPLPNSDATTGTQGAGALLEAGAAQETPTPQNTAGGTSTFAAIALEPARVPTKSRPPKMSYRTRSTATASLTAEKGGEDATGAAAVPVSITSTKRKGQDTGGGPAALSPTNPPAVPPPPGTVKKLKTNEHKTDCKTHPRKRFPAATPLEHGIGPHGDLTKNKQEGQEQAISPAPAPAHKRAKNHHNTPRQPPAGANLAGGIAAKPTPKQPQKPAPASPAGAAVLAHSGPPKGQDLTGQPSSVHRGRARDKH